MRYCQFCGATKIEEEQTILAAAHVYAASCVAYLEWSDVWRSVRTTDPQWDAVRLTWQATIQAKQDAAQMLLAAAQMLPARPRCMCCEMNNEATIGGICPACAEVQHNRANC